MVSNDFKKLWLLAGLIMFVSSLTALEPPLKARPIDEDGDGKPEHWEMPTEGDRMKTFADTDGDGLIDYIQEYDAKGYRIYEALDFNGDGDIDDHYYYLKDVLQYREIDSNYDGNIDIWVYLREGVYVDRYKRDTDFDGKVDLEKSFGKKK